MCPNKYPYDLGPSLVSWDIHPKGGCKARTGGVRSSVATDNKGTGAHKLQIGGEDSLLYVVHQNVYVLKTGI